MKIKRRNRKKTFWQKHSRILKWLAVWTVTIIVYAILHKAGTAQRGYEAIGGEMFAFLIPFFVWNAPNCKGIFGGS